MGDEGDSRWAHGEARSPEAGRDDAGGAGSPGRFAGRPLEFRSHVLAWARTNLRDLPWRRTLDPYAILVSEVMLQQTQVPRVVPRYTSFLGRFGSFAALARAPLADVLAEWSGLGYNSRAVRLRRTAQTVVEQHGGALPLDLAALHALPGIGPYTARAVLIFATNAGLAAVDTNVRRVLSHELGLDLDLSPAALQQIAEEVLPPGGARLWHHALMDYGSAVVTAKVARAAGAPGVRRQPAFVGSLRQARGRLVRQLLAGAGGRSAAWLAREVDLDFDVVSAALAGLVADGVVVRRANGHFMLADG